MSEKCHTCYSADFSTIFIKKGILINNSARSKSDSEFVYSSEYDFYWKLIAERDHLCHQCNNCKYEWRTASVGITETIQHKKIRITIFALNASGNNISDDLLGEFALTQNVKITCQAKSDVFIATIEDTTIHEQGIYAKGEGKSSIAATVECINDYVRQHQL